MNDPIILRALRALILAQLRQRDYLTKEELFALESSLKETDNQLKYYAQP